MWNLFCLVAANGIFRVISTEAFCCLLVGKKVPLMNNIILDCGVEGRNRRFYPILVLSLRLKFPRISQGTGQSGRLLGSYKICMFKE